MSSLKSFLRTRTLFFLGSLLWLPAGIVVMSLFRNPRFLQEPELSPVTALMMAMSLIVVAPCGLPLTLGCRLLWRQGYSYAAWCAMAVLGPVTVGASFLAGLLGPVAIALYAAVLSLPVWIAAGVVHRLHRNS